jgi:hypothetical protein
LLHVVLSINRDPTAGPRSQGGANAASLSADSYPNPGFSNSYGGFTRGSSIPATLIGGEAPEIK